MSSCPNCHNKTTKFSDFAKVTNDFFSKEFPAGQVRVEIKTTAKAPLSTGVAVKPAAFTDEFKVATVRDSATGAISAEVKSTTCMPLGIGKMEAKSQTTLNSASQLTQQVTLCNAVLEGLKLDVVGSVQGANSTKSTKVALEFAQPMLAASASVDVFKGPLLGAEMAARFRDFLLGGEISYDVKKAQIDKYSAAVSFDRPREKVVVQALTGFNVFNAAYYQKFNDQVEVAYRASWNHKVSSLSMEIGAKYFLAPTSTSNFIKTKLDNAGRLGLALATDLRPGVQLNLGASVDTAKLNEDAHKFGIELNYSA